MYAEMYSPDKSLALIFNSLTEGMAGVYNCTASYANSEFLAASVTIETYGTYQWLTTPLRNPTFFATTTMLRCLSGRLTL